MKRSILWDRCNLVKVKKESNKITSNKIGVAILKLYNTPPRLKKLNGIIIKVNK